jgi:hydrogenase maturation protease
MNGGPHPVRLVALGALDRGDDGAGLVAVDLLPRDVRDRCEIRRAGCLDVLELVDLAPNRACVIADAARGIAPGAVALIPFAALIEGDVGLPQPRSSHELPVAELLRLAQVVRDGPPAGCFVVIGGAEFDLGLGLSPVVKRALPALVEALAGAIEEWERCVSRSSAA